ncbi:MAG: phosphatidate cytidylyltransferase [Treponemataceae bacterium]
MNSLGKNRPMTFLSSIDSSAELRTELLRKSIHFLIALAPTIASIDRSVAVFLLAAGALVYTYAERARLSGFKVPLISGLTAAASRERDQGRFVLGPVTLALGAMLSLLLYPDPSASIAIYALAFGDGFASIVGKVFGRTRPAFLNGKSLEGSAACFIAVFYAAYRVAGDLRIAFFAATVATFVEALPIEDFDNIALPVAVGFTIELVTIVQR